jgi:Rrf2 family protein
MNNSRFAVAIHTLAVLAHHCEAPATSDLIAESVNTNPVVIRRLIALLRRAGLVSTRTGRGGGFALGREAKKITLLDIYRAVEEREVLPVHDSPNQRCPIGREVSEVIHRYTLAAEKAMEQSLGSTTLQQLVETLGRKMRNCR